ncbi:hypothetical protein WG66_008445 [Moniliophthora roreri]|nr:hypothetical protein WG66_008445 [Moniliophthora roreri]
MIHIDRNQVHNHHPPLSNSHSPQKNTNNLILPNNQHQHHNHFSNSPSHSSPSPWSPSTITNIKQDQERESTPPPPADGSAPGNVDTTSPQRSSSLSPVPDQQQTDANGNAETQENDQDISNKISSRLSTPLSELSPPPDDMDTPAPAEAEEAKEENKAGDVEGGDGEGGASAAEVKREVNGTSPKPFSNNNSQQTNRGSGSEGSGGESKQPQPPFQDTTSTQDPNPNRKADLILQLNAELFNVALELQKKGTSPTDPTFLQYMQRMQSNLDYMARWADNRAASSTHTPLPIMEAPPPPLWAGINVDRIEQLYRELTPLFAKALARRDGMLGPNPSMTANLKRERSEEASSFDTNKRRDTGENKMFNPQTQSQSMPPPSLPGSQPLDQLSNSAASSSMVNGMPSLSSQSQMSQMGDPNSAGGGISPSGMINPMDAQRMAAMRNMQQQRQQQQQQQPGMSNRQMSPPAQSGVNPVGSSMGGAPSMVTPQQAMAIASNPNHPMMVHIMSRIPTFTSLPQQEQARKIMQVAAMRQQELQNQQQQQQQNPMGQGMNRPGPGGMAGMNNMNNMNMNNMNMNMSSSGGMPGGPASPVAHQAQMAQNPMMMGQGGSNTVGMDPQRSMSATPQLGGGMGGMPNSPMNMSQMNQRQLMLIQQQNRAAGGPGAGGGGGVGGNLNAGNIMMNMNPQQQMALMQERMRQQQQQQQGSPTQQMPGGDGFAPPVLRSNSTIPGIARSARSPTDGMQSPMTPRMPNRVSSMGQDDFSRMMMQQQQQQQQQGVSGPSRGMQPGPQGGFNPQQMQQSSWQQQQMGSPYGMNSRPESAAGFYGGGSGGGSNGVLGGGSPPGGMAQTWGTPNNANAGSYPFATPSPGHQSDLAPTPRHMSATPAPMQPQNMISPTSADSFPFANDFDFSNWTQ